jgi:lipoprotein-anchoring transpeptidase ErfK/SrfK
MILIAALSVPLKADEPKTRRIVISLADRKLVLLEGERVVKVYDTAIGKPTTPTPEGEFEVVNRIPHPTWFGKGKPVPPGRSNPLGTRWLGLSKSGYGIHGTNAPASIGSAASKGCIRMNNRDVEELFPLVQVGVHVEISTAPATKFTKLMSAD